LHGYPEGFFAMPTPRFSIVIPTRERPDTLAFALRTCLDQEFDDFEIVVGDNCGGPRTRQTIEELHSSKVQHVRSEKPLAMSDNWERSIAEARGDYVLLIGDDDGILAHGLRELDALIRREKAAIVRWTGAFYTWPTIDLPGQANYLRIPLGRGLRWVDWREAVEAVVRFEACYSTLPMFYNSAVHRDVIAALRRRGGRVFANQIPDVYSGFALANVAGRFLSTDVPMTVAGTSGGSFGVANLFHRGRSALDREFRELNRAAGFSTHPWVPDLPIFPHVPVADSFLFAKELLFSGEQNLKLDRRSLAAHCVAGLRAASEMEWREGLSAIRESFKDEPQSQAWFDQTLGSAPYQSPKPVQLRNSRPGVDEGCLHLAADSFGVTDVHGAALLVEQVLGYRSGGVAFEIARQAAPEKPKPSEPMPLQPAGSGDHVGTLQAAEIDLFRLLGEHLNTRFMIDVGAHHGTTLAPFLQADWKVLAFEPMETNRAVLQQRHDQNPFLTVRPEAVSDHSGVRTLQLALNLDGSPHDYYHSLERTRTDRYHRKGAKVEVPVVSLDDIADRGETPCEVGFLKIDTEGHDLAVLRGASRLTCESIAVEFWGQDHPLGPSPSPAPAVISLMHERGYPFYLVLSHQEGATLVLGSTMEGVKQTSWGNLLFFHRSRQDLYEHLLAKLGSATTPSIAPGGDSRLLRLLGLVFPGRTGLRVAQIGPGDREFLPVLQTAFPASTFENLVPGSQPVDLFRLTSAPDAAVLLQSVVSLLGSESAVLLERTSGPDKFAVVFEVGTLLQSRGYQLAGLLRPLVSEEGVFGGADLVWLSPSLYARCEANRGAFGVLDADSLLEQTRQLQQTCDQRGQLLTEQALALERLEAERISLTAGRDEFQAAAEQRLTAIEKISQIAAERQQVLESVHAQAKQLREELAQVQAELEWHRTGHLRRTWAHLRGKKLPDPRRSRAPIGS
jgi:FkbM family methyltransferase